MELLCKGRGALNKLNLTKKNHGQIRPNEDFTKTEFVQPAEFIQANAFFTLINAPTIFPVEWDSYLDSV